MKFRIGTHEYDIENEMIRGICKLCGLPILKSDAKIPKKMDVSLWFDLGLDVGNELHEMCDMQPQYFTHHPLSTPSKLQHTVTRD